MHGQEKHQIIPYIAWRPCWQSTATAFWWRVTHVGYWSTCDI